MIGIVGGTGLSRFDGLTDFESRSVETPFGPPSADVCIGRYHETPIAFLPRHGPDHHLLPGEINYRANIWALKSVGVTRVISVSAVGSLAAEIHPADIAVPAQYLDFTKGTRAHTFFGNGIVGHISTANPTCSRISAQLAQAAQSCDLTLHKRRVYACVEGPRLGNKAESAMLRSIGAHLVGMTNVPEVYLAREAQLCYCTLAIVTDYDCWMEDPGAHASVDQVIALYRQNIDNVRRIIGQFVEDAGEDDDCACRHALDHAVLTPNDALSDERRDYLAFLRA